MVHNSILRNTYFNLINDVLITLCAIKIIDKDIYFKNVTYKTLIEPLNNKKIQRRQNMYIFSLDYRYYKLTIKSYINHKFIKHFFTVFLPIIKKILYKAAF